MEGHLPSIGCSCQSFIVIIEHSPFEIPGSVQEITQKFAINNVLAMYCTRT